MGSGSTTRPLIRAYLYRGAARGATMGIALLVLLGMLAVGAALGELISWLVYGQGLVVGRRG